MYQGPRLTNAQQGPGQLCSAMLVCCCCCGGHEAQEHHTPEALGRSRTVLGTACISESYHQAGRGKEMMSDQTAKFVHVPLSLYLLFLTDARSQLAVVFYLPGDLLDSVCHFTSQALTQYIKSLHTGTADSTLTCAPLGQYVPYLEVPVWIQLCCWQYKQLQDCLLLPDAHGHIPLASPAAPTPQQAAQCSTQLNAQVDALISLNKMTPTVTPAPYHLSRQPAILFSCWSPPATKQSSSCQNIKP